MSETTFWSLYYDPKNKVRKQNRQEREAAYATLADEKAEIEGDAAYKKAFATAFGGRSPNERVLLAHALPRARIGFLSAEGNFNTLAKTVLGLGAKRVGRLRREIREKPTREQGVRSYLAWRARECQALKDKKRAESEKTTAKITREIKRREALEHEG